MRRAYKDRSYVIITVQVEELSGMRKIGDVITQLNRIIICRTHKNAKKFLGERVYTEDGTLVGIIVDIFGPVERPYLKIIKKNGNHAGTLYVK